MHPGNYDVFYKRRLKLRQKIEEAFHYASHDIVLLFANFEQTKYSFRQESSFFYLTGITEPGVVVVLYGDGKDVAYIPQFATSRAQWVTVTMCASEHDGGKSAQEMKLSNIAFLGKPQPGYVLSSKAAADAYTYLVEDIKERLVRGGKVYTLVADSTALYDGALQRYERLKTIIGLQPETLDIADIVHDMRVTKETYERILIQRAVDVTAAAHEVGAIAIRNGIEEGAVKSIIEYVFSHEGACKAFPSIVATGKNATVLHYTDMKKMLFEGDLVVIDVGAEYEYYCADLTRTYPVSGYFTERQKVVYNTVLETQEYVASVARPGMYLRNEDKPHESLHHMAVEFLRKKGYDRYFMHGIGHYLGLDVHDVGSYKKPLQPGHVFTIEPGIYIRDEGLGVRIEDNYIMTENGVECLSRALIKEIPLVEEMMRNR